MKMQTVDSRLLVFTAGYHDHSLSVIGPSRAQAVASLDVVETWDGMAYDAASGTVFLSGGGHAKRGFAELIARLGIRLSMKDSVDTPILRVHYADGKLSPEPPIGIRGLKEDDRYISGLAVGPDHALYALIRRPPVRGGFGIERGQGDFGWERHRNDPHRSIRKLRWDRLRMRWPFHRTAGDFMWLTQITTTQP
jgi:hypothetical protein